LSSGARRFMPSAPARMESDCRMPCILRSCGPEVLLVA
jgi:hypothetical protein